MTNEELLDYMETAIETFGHGSVRCFTGETIWRWSGQPVLLCFNSMDLTHAERWVLEYDYRIAFLFHIYDV
jgi:hypothetical protein